MAFVGRGQQLSSDGVVGLHCTGHNGATQSPEVRGPIRQEGPQDGGQDGLGGSIRGGRHTQLSEVAHKAGGQRLPTPSCRGDSTAEIPIRRMVL